MKIGASLKFLEISVLDHACTYHVLPKYTLTAYIYVYIYNIYIYIYIYMYIAKYNVLITKIRTLSMLLTCKLL